MKEIKNTKKLVLFEESIKSGNKIYRLNKEDEKKEKILIYTFIKGNIIYEYEGEKIKTIIIEDTDQFPPFLSSYGYGFSERSLNNFFRYNFNDDKIDTIILS